MSETLSKNAGGLDSSVQARYQEALSEAFRHPLVRHFAQIARDFPELHLRNALPGMDRGSIDLSHPHLELASRSLDALLAGRVDLAAAALQQQITILVSVGAAPDREQQIRDAQYLLGVTLSLPKQAESILSSILSAAMGGDEFERRFASVAEAATKPVDGIVH